MARKARSSMQDWRYSPETIAAILRKEELAAKWLAWKKFTVHPGEAALWMSRGKVVKVVSEGQSVASGVMDRLKSIFGAGEDLVLMFLDTSEIVLRTFNLGLTKEDVMKGEDEGRFFEDLHVAYNPAATRPERYDLKNKYEKAEDIKKRKDDLKVEAKERTKDFKSGNKSKGDSDGDGGDDSDPFESYKKEVDKALKRGSAILTKDRESVLFRVRVVVNFQTEKAKEIFKLISGQNWPMFEQENFRLLIRQELESRVFASEISQYTSSELRTNNEIMSRVHKKAEEELFQWLSNYGIKLNRLSINPAITDSEKAGVIDKERQALADVAAKQHQRDLAQTKWEYEHLLLREKLAADLEKAKAVGDEETEAIARAGFISDKEQKLSLAEIDVKIQQIVNETRLQIQAKEEELRLLGIQREAEVETHKMQAWAEEYRKNKQMKEQLKIENMEVRRSTDQGVQEHVERITEVAAKAGALTAETAADIIRQATVRKALDEGDVAAQAFGMAEGQKHSKESFQEGLRSHPPIGMAGQGTLYVQSGQNIGPPQTPQLGQQSQGHYIAPPNVQGSVEMHDCPHCNKQIPADSVYCGYCSEEVKQEN